MNGGEEEERLCKLWGRWGLWSVVKVQATLNFPTPAFLIFLSFQSVLELCLSKDFQMHLSHFNPSPELQTRISRL